MTTTGEAKIAARLDRLPSARHLWGLVVLISFGAFFEIYDVALSGPLSTGLLAAGVFRDGQNGLFGVTDQATFTALTFAGLYLGTVLFSTIADRFGRKPIFAWSLLWYGAATVIMGLQTSVIGIDIWRCIAAIGVGVELVAIDCYLAELMPAALRGRAFAVSTAIQFLAAVLVGGLSLKVMPHAPLGVAGWRWLAFVPGVGALLIWVVRRGLPESPRWLAARGRTAEAAAIVSAIEARIIQQTGRQLPPPTPTPPVMPEADGGFAELWRSPYRRRTVMMIAFHLLQTIGYFGFGNWLPTLLVKQGVTLTKSLTYQLLVVLILPVVPLVAAAITDRIERKWLIVAGSLTAAAFGLLFSRVTNSSNMGLYTGFGIMVAVGTSLMSLGYHIYQSELFPTRIRARAVGFVYSFSRLSAIFSTYLIAWVLQGSGSGGVFALISASLFGVALVIGIFGPRTKGLSLEQISAA